MKMGNCQVSSMAEFYISGAGVVFYAFIIFIINVNGCKQKFILLTKYNLTTGTFIYNNFCLTNL